MESEGEAEILRTLLDDLREAFHHKRAKHAVQAAQKAYMAAAMALGHMERQKPIQLVGSTYPAKSPADA